MKSNLYRLATSRVTRVSVGLLISAAFLYLAARDVDFVETWQAILGAKSAWISLALGSVAVNTLSKAFRWRVLLGPNGKGIPLRQLLISILVGQTLNSLIPARMGDLSRVYVVGSMGPGRSFTLGTVVLEKLLDLLAYALLLITLLFLIPIPGWVSSSAYTLAITAAIFALLVALITTWRDRVTEYLARLAGWLPQALERRIVKALHSGMSSLKILQSRAALLTVIFWSLLVWTTAVLTNQLTLVALNIRLPLTAPVLVLIALQAGISFPAVPGRIGLFEYLCVLALGFFGISQGSAFGYGVLLHAIVFLPTNLIGLIAIWILGINGKEAFQTPLLEGQDPLQ